MKFGFFKEFRGLSSTIESVSQFLMVDLTSTLRELAVGLTRLEFQDNFNCFIEQNLVIPANTEVAIRNKLNKTIPTQRIILRSNSTSIVDGDTEWDLNYVYLKNTSGTDATVTVAFLV